MKSRTRRTSRLFLAAIFAMTLVRSSSSSRGDSANEAIESLRRSSASQSDPKTVIERYKQFIARNPAMSADANKDLAMWQDRLDKGLVRVGKDWVTPAERDALKESALAQAELAAQLLEKGDPRAAELQAIKVLEADPTNTGSLYIRGVIEANSGRLGPARRDFEAVKTLTPGHGPTLNNMAVVAWKQRHEPEALGLYDQALRAMPAERATMDNVVEAWATESKAWLQLSGKRLTARAREQEPLLEKRMSDQQGLTRWGSKWLTPDQLAKAKEAEKLVEEQVKPVQVQVDQINTEVADLDRRIKDDQNRIQQAQSMRSAYGSGSVPGYRDPNTGAFIPTTTPGVQNSGQFPNYGTGYGGINGGYSGATYEIASLQSDMQTLNSQKRQSAATLAPLLRQVNDIRRSLNAQKYSGEQNLIGPEGMPGRVYPKPNPTTAPTTAPATNLPFDIWPGARPPTVPLSTPLLPPQLSSAPAVVPTAPPPTTQSAAPVSKPWGPGARK